MQSLAISLIQSNIHWEDKDRNLLMFEEKIMAISENTNMVVLPEMFNTAFSMKPKLLAEEMDGPTVAWMKKIASRKKIILTGSMMIKENDQYYNRLIWMQPDGKFGYYDKRHLFSYGGEGNEFAEGNKRFIAQVNSWKICTLICYDLRFPVWSRLSREDEYDVLLIVANWPVSRINAWKSLLIARAIENQCYVVAVNRIGKDGSGLEYNGQSCIINPFGDMMVSGGDSALNFHGMLNKEELSAIRLKFPFQKDKDDFMIL